MCHPHYKRWLRCGDPLGVRRSVGRKVDLETRLWHYVQRGAPDECWPWTGAVSRHGYGKITVARKAVPTHRLVYELTHGPIPKGLVVRHACDNRPCCNPAHLLVGTPADNSQDMLDRGRSKGPFNHGMAKLTEGQVREIRVVYAQGGTSYLKLGRRYGVAAGTVHDVVKRRRWQHVE